MKFKFKLHQHLCDRLTGFDGVVLARTEYATGCNHYGLCPLKLDKEGKIQDYEWLDESRLKVHTKKKVEPTTHTSRGGAFLPNPPQS